MSSTITEYNLCLNCHGNYMYEDRANSGPMLYQFCVRCGYMVDTNENGETEYGGGDGAFRFIAPPIVETGETTGGIVGYHTDFDLILADLTHKKKTGQVQEAFISYLKDDEWMVHVLSTGDTLTWEEFNNYGSE